MRNKKLFSTVLAASLAATTMAMPVMAEGESGSLDAEFTSKTAITRVQVPTTMAVEIDQYEIGEDGCQIACVKAFDMTNLSEMAVKVDVASTVTKNNVTLVGSKSAAKESVSGDVAWLAVAAQVSGDAKYDLSAADPKKCGGLDETDANVATFDQSGDAKQTFYLAKANGSASYKWATSGDAVDVNYARFYELKDTNAATSGDVAAIAKDDDVYVARSGDAKDLDKITADTTNITFNSGDVAYVVSGDAIDNKDVTGNGKYMYGEMSSSEGKAGFRYIGNLSEVDGEQWTKEKIEKIHIVYNIKGVTGETYNKVKNDCTYGLYTAAREAAPSIAKKSYKMVANTPIEISVDLGAGDLKATGVSNIMDPSGAWDYLAHSEQATYDATTKKITLKAGMVDACIAANVPSINVIFDDEESTSITVALTK